MKLIVFVAILAFCFSKVFSQGPVDGFMQQKGKTVLAFSLTAEANSNYFAGTDKVTASRQVTSLSFYGAHGLSNKFHLQYALPFVIANFEEFGLQDDQLMLKYRPFYQSNEKGNRSSLILATGLSRPVMEYETEGLAALGQRAIAFENRLIYQFEFNNKFITLISGYTYRIEPVPSSIPATVKFGLIKDRDYCDFWAEGQYSEDGKDYRGTGDRAPSTFREITVSYLRIGGTWYRSLGEKTGFSLAAAFTPYGRNVAQSFRISFGFVILPN